MTKANAESKAEAEAEAEAKARAKARAEQKARAKVLPACGGIRAQLPGQSSPLLHQHQHQCQCQQVAPGQHSRQAENTSPVPHHGIPVTRHDIVATNAEGPLHMQRAFTVPPARTA
jgi:hypothetical protein